MMPFQLTLTSLLERAGRLFPTTPVVTQRPDGTTHRYTYRDFYLRARSLAAALQQLGLRCGERVATLMWNHHRHLEAYFGVPAVGGVLHTLNLRLHPAYIVNHAKDRFLIVDDVLLPAFAQIQGRVKLDRVIVAPRGRTSCAWLIKSGGEWISSIDMENALVSHPAVAEAAVIAVPDPKWQERPLAVVVKKPAESRQRYQAWPMENLVAHG